MNENLQEMKEDRSITIFHYHFYVIQNRTEFLFHFSLTHFILISWNWDFISSHRMRIQSHLVLISCWFWFCFISQVTIQFHFISISCHSDSVSSYFIEIWFCLILFHENLILFDFISQKFWFCFIYMLNSALLTRSKKLCAVIWTWIIELQQII